VNASVGPEPAYWAKGKLGRLTTIDATGMPHVVPSAGATTPDLTSSTSAAATSPGAGISQCAAQPNVALVIDDVLAPWRPRSVVIRGTAEALAEAIGPDGQATGPMIRLHPAEVISRGMEFAAE
jgi:pyridoxamine 5'-phosphate oxidase family protein